MGIATDHGGFDLKEGLVAHLRAAGHEVVDFGAHELNPGQGRTGSIRDEAVKAAVNRVQGTGATVVQKISVLAGRKL